MAEIIDNQDEEYNDDDQIVNDDGHDSEGLTEQEPITADQPLEYAEALDENQNGKPASLTAARHLQGLQPGRD